MAPTLPPPSPRATVSLLRIRRGLLLAAGSILAVALAGMLAAWEFYWRLPVGNGPAGPAVRREAFNSPWTTHPVLLVGLGDSVTAGFGASAGLSYFDRLVRNPPEEFPELKGICLATVLPQLRVTNLAVSGSTSLQHARGQLPRLTPQPTNVLGIVVITTGGNDLIHDYGRSPPREGAMFGASLEQARPWIRNFDQRLEGMIGELERRFPGGCHIFLANIYDPTDGVGSARVVGLPGWPDGLAVLDAYNRVLAECAGRHRSVHLVDIRTPFLGHGLFCSQFWRAHYRKGDPTYWYLDNLEDPNDRGYDALRRLFLNAMAEVLQPQPNSAALAPGRPGS
jgi:lysophospholipase L1-like esterase